MHIGEYLLLISVWTGLAYLFYAMPAIRRAAHGSTATLTERNVVALTIVIPTALALGFRSLDFGIDTRTYYDLYQQFCFFGAGDFDLSYMASFQLIRALSLGACSNQLLIPVWSLAVVAGFLTLPLDRTMRIRLLTLGLLSLVGIEITTNAFRQGISSVALMVGVVWFERNRLVAMALFGLAVLLHSSAALAVLAVLLATLSWRWFLVGLAGIAFAALNYERLAFIGPIESLIYEVTKYSAHESDELWIRVIAGTQMAILLGTAALFTPKPASEAPDDPAISARADLATAFKLAITALPYLPMPYFGYRYIYGIYFAVLVLVRRTVTSDRSMAFEALLASNLALTLAWAFGSSSISSTPFIGQ